MLKWTNVVFSLFVFAAFQSVAGQQGVMSYCSSGFTLIPDRSFNGILDTLSVPDAGSISNLTVSVDIRHQRVGDLSLNLQNPQTFQQVNLVFRPGEPATAFGCTSSDVIAEFSDDASELAEDQCFPSSPAIRDVVAPTQPLTTFDQRQINGDWILRAADFEFGVDGFLLEWCLNATLDPQTPPPLVLSTIPPSGTTDFAVAGRVEFQIDQRVTIDLPTAIFECDGSAIPYSISLNTQNVISLAPQQDLATGANCTVTLQSDQVQDFNLQSLDGNQNGISEGTPTDDVELSFSVVDPAPVFLRSFPAAGQDGVSTYSEIALEFSEPVSFNSGATTVECGGQAVAFTVENQPDNSRLVLKPVQPLPSTTCVLDIDPTQILDTDGLPQELQGVAGPIAFTVRPESPGRFPGFCVGTVPPGPDDFETDNTLGDAVAVPVRVARNDFGEAPYVYQQRSFHTTDDVDWIKFDAPDPDSGYRLVLRAPDPGAGVIMDRITGRGTGFLVEYFDESGNVLPIVEPPFHNNSPPVFEFGPTYTGRCETVSPYDPEALFAGPDGTYGIIGNGSTIYARISQCRNADLDIDANGVADDEQFCLPGGEANYELAVSEARVTVFGLVSGRILDAQTGEPIRAAIVGDVTEVFYTFTDDNGDFIQDVINTSDEFTPPAEAVVIAEGYAEERIRFDVDIGQETECGTILLERAPGKSRDLKISAPKVLTNVIEGGEAEFEATIQNLGPLDSPPTEIRFLASPDTVIDPSDLTLATATVGGLAPATSITTQASGRVSSEASTATYFGACIDEADGSSDSNNCVGYAVLNALSSAIFESGFEGLTGQANKRPVSPVTKGVTCTVLEE